MLLLTFSFLTFLQSWLAPPPASPPEACTTTFVVTSCSEKPVPGAKIQLITGYEGRIKDKTDKEGRVVFDKCLLNYKIYGEPKLYLASGDSAYVYKVFPNGHIIRITSHKRVEKMTSYLKYSYFSGGSDFYEYSDSILLYKVDDPTAIVRMSMKYRTNRSSKLGLRKEGSKMKLGNKAIKNFVTGECIWENGGWVCPINICS